MIFQIVLRVRKDGFSDDFECCKGLEIWFYNRGLVVYLSLSPKRFLKHPKCSFPSFRVTFKESDLVIEKMAILHISCLEIRYESKDIISNVQ